VVWALDPIMNCGKLNISCEGYSMQGSQPAVPCPTSNPMLDSIYSF